MLTWLNDTLLLLNNNSSKKNIGGYTRLGFSSEEDLSIQAFITIAKQLHLKIEIDAIGNVFAKWQGSNIDLPSIAFGSHLDTVINGGAYDGVAGVLAGLGVIKQLQNMNYQPLHSIEIICFRAEESSRFGVSTTGSKAMTNLLKIDKIKDLKDTNGITVKEALERLHFNLTNIKSMNWKDRNFHSFVELHTEQGLILNLSDKEIGIVKAIASPLRLKIIIHGDANHTGTTPMNNRSDALATTAKIITFIEKKGYFFSKREHFVATASTINNYPNAMNVIPKTVELGVDIRSINKQLLNDFYQQLHNYCRMVSSQKNTQIKCIELANETPVLMNESVIERLKQACHKSNKSYCEMISGAGHDAMNMAQRWPSAMVFIPCNGVSHNPNEFTEIKNIANGIDVLTNYIKLIDYEVE